MGAALGKIVEELVIAFKNNYKRPRLWIVIFVFIIFLVLLIPYIDSNFFYFSRIEKRINILEKVMRLDEEKIKTNPAYVIEYESILNEMKLQSEHSINSLMNKIVNQMNQLSSNGGNKIIKFLTGAIWMIIVTLLVPFMNTFKGKREKVQAFFLMIFLTMIVGIVFSLIPIIFTPIINYIGFPLLQIFVVIIISVKSNQKKADKKEVEAKS